MKLHSLPVLFVVVAGCATSPGTVTITTGSPPELVAFRDEANPTWQLFEVAGRTTFEVAVTSPYRVVVACALPSGGISIEELARTPLDSPVIDNACFAFPFTVQGMVNQDSFIGLGNVGLSVVPSMVPASFQFPAAAGTFDLVQLLGNGASFDGIAIKHDVVIAGNTDLGLVDLAQGSPDALVAKSFVPDNVDDGESVSSGTVLFSGNTIVRIDTMQPQLGGGWDTRLAPETALRATDRQNVILTAASADGGSGAVIHARTVRRDVHANGVPSVMLPDALGPVTFAASPSRLVATWSSLPPHDQLSMARATSVFGVGVVLHGVSFSESFIDATGIAAATLDLSDVPDIKPEWQLARGVSQGVTFTATRGGSVSDSATSVVSEVLPATQGRAGDAGPLPPLVNGTTGVELLDARLGLPGARAVN